MSKQNVQVDEEQNRTYRGSKYRIVYRYMQNKPLSVFVMGPNSDSLSVNREDLNDLIDLLQSSLISEETRKSA